MHSKFLLLLGVSGAGKSTLIHSLKAIDSRFIYIKPYTNRPLRTGETEKIHKTLNEINDLIRQGEIILVSELYGYIYATPRKIILDSFEQGNFPILDFPIQRLSEIQQLFPGKTYSIYILPPDEITLQNRLNDGRDINGGRYTFAMEEIKAVKNYSLGGFDELIVNATGRATQIAEGIYHSFIASCKRPHLVNK